jgi:hypothetical protein
VKGQEALAIWNILRGNAFEAMIFIVDALNIVVYSCEKKRKELKCIMYPRLFALKSICQTGIDICMYIMHVYKYSYIHIFIY